MSHEPSKIILIRNLNGDTFIRNDIRIIRHLNSRRKVNNVFIQRSGRVIMRRVRPRKLINTYTVYSNHYSKSLQEGPNITHTDYRQVSDRLRTCCRRIINKLHNVSKVTIKGMQHRGDSPKTHLFGCGVNEGSFTYSCSLCTLQELQ